MCPRRSVSLWTVILYGGYSLLTFTHAGAQTDWTAIARKLSKSVVFIQTDGGSCTGFVSDDHHLVDKHDRDLVVTAAHCLGAQMFVDQEPATVVSKDLKKDLMVLEIEDTGRPALRLARNNPAQGQQVASFGFGAGLERPMLRLATISDDDTYIPEDGIGGPLMVTDAAFVAGQSGGPVINAAGEVVMIVQRASGTFGVGVGAETIHSKIGRYFAKDEPVKQP